VVGELTKIVKKLNQRRVVGKPTASTNVRCFGSAMLIHVHVYSA